MFEQISFFVAAEMAPGERVVDKLGTANAAEGSTDTVNNIRKL